MLSKCIIIDDEPLAIEVIATHLKQIPTLEIMNTFQNPLNAYQYLKEHSVDLIFLDIEMPLLSGIDFVKNLEHPPKIILTTAHRDYAVTSYELDVVDYLLKPISFSRLFKAINKFYAFKDEQEKSALLQESNAADHLYVNSNKKYIKILFDDILYVESLKDYVRIHLQDKKVITKETIGNFLEKLPHQFLRVHRSYVVNTAKITAFTSLDVEIETQEIPIGASYKNEVMQFLKE